MKKIKKPSKRQIAKQIAKADARIAALEAQAIEAHRRLNQLESDISAPDAVPPVVAEVGLPPSA
jgi:septal ring factor EnvC (AmiA/AmiB activator)